MGNSGRQYGAWYPAHPLGDGPFACRARSAVDCAAVLLAAAACALLSSAEISAVQGEKPVRSKASSSDADGLSVERCFFEMPTFPKSISLEVTRGTRVRELWKRSFHQEGEREREEEEEEQPPPQRVRGLGEEAFWVGDPRLGGLYVLRKDTMLRLAVGGAEGMADKLRKLKPLARKALSRL